MKIIEMDQEFPQEGQRNRQPHEARQEVRHGGVRRNLLGEFDAILDQVYPKRYATS